MQRDEILGLMRRIARDFAPLLPGIRLEVVPPEGFRDRLRGKPLVADEATLRKTLEERRERASAPASAAEPEGPMESVGAGKQEEQRGEATPPLISFPASRTILVEMEALCRTVAREDRRLHRPLVEGLMLREVIYLVTCRQPFPDPRARAETILRRHWPFQYAALRSVGLTVTGFERPSPRRDLARDN